MVNDWQIYHSTAEEIGTAHALGTLLLELVAIISSISLAAVEWARDRRRESLVPERRQSRTYIRVR